MLLGLRSILVKGRLQYDISWSRRSGETFGSKR
jgi:hypothetical protein